MVWLRHHVIRIVGMCWLLSTSTALAQVPSTNGTDFWLTFMQNSGVPSTYLFLGADTSATAKIYMGNTLLATVAIPNDGNVAYPVVAAGATITTSDVISVGKAIRVTSDRPISLSLFNTLSTSTDATIVYPVPALGDRYVVPSYRHYASANWSSQVAVVSYQDGTVVEITPTAEIKRTGGGSRPANTPFQITLNRGDVYQFQTVRSPDDLTGTQIRVVAGGSSCSGVAVFSGHQRTTVPFTSNQTRDHLVEQIPPTRSLGKTFVVPPVAYATKHVVRIIASEPATTVTFDGTVASIAQTGGFLEYTVNAQTFHTIETDKPALVALYAMSWTDGFDLVRGVGDPFMVIIPPIEQRTKYFTVNAFVPPTSTQPLVVNNWQQNLYLALIADANDINQIALNGLALSSLVGKTTLPRVYNTTPIDATRTCVTINVPEGVHTVNARSGKGVVGIFYGLSTFDSYGFLAGSDFANLRTTIRVADTPYCLGRELTFIAESQDSADISRYAWYFDHDQSTAEGKRVTRRFTKPGQYTVRVVSTRLGCFTDTSSITFTVSQPVVLNVSALSTSLCVGQDIVAQARVPDSLRIRSIRWDVARGRAQARTDTTKSTVRYNVADTGTVVLRVLVVDTNGCEAVDSVRIRVHPLPVVDVLDTLRICEGRDTSVTVRAPVGPGYTYQWSGRDEVSRRTIYGARNLPVVGLRCATAGRILLDLVVTNQFGCKTIDSVIVIVHDLPRITIGSDRAVVSCVEGEVPEVVLGDSLRIDGGDPPYRYQWSEASGGSTSIVTSTTSPSIRVRPTVTTTYVLRVTDSRRPSACTSVRQFTVEVSDRPVADAGPDLVICACDTARRMIGFDTQCGVPPFRYVWTPTTGLTNPTSTTTATTEARPSVTTTYVLQVSDARNITVFDTIDVAIAPCPTVELEPVVYACAEGDATIRVGGTAQSLGSTIRWEPSTLVDDATSFTPRITLPSRIDSIVLTATVVTPEGCRGAGATVVRRADSIRVDAVASPSCATDTVCRGDSVALDAIVTTDAAVSSVTWTIDNGIVMQGARVSVRVNEDTRCIVDVITAQGCRATDTVDVCVATRPNLILRDTAVCAANRGAIDVRVPAPVATCGIAPFVYAWEPASAVSIPDTNEPWNAVAQTDSTMDIILRVTDDAGAGVSAVDTMRITIGRPPVLDPLPDTVIVCGAGDAPDVRVRVHGAWQSGVAVWTVGGDTISIVPLVPFNAILQVPTALVPSVRVQTVYLDVVTDGACRTRDSLVLAVYDPPRVDLRTQTSSCPCDSVVIVADIATSSSIRSVVWYADEIDPDTSGPVIVAVDTNAVAVQPRGRTIYRVHVTDVRGCLRVASILLETGSAAVVPTIRIDTVRTPPLRDEVAIPLLLEGARQGLTCEQTTVRCTLTYDESLFEPFPRLDYGAIMQNTVEVRNGLRQRVLVLELPYRGATGDVDTLTVLRGRALIGYPGRTPLTLQDIVWNNGCVEVPGAGVAGELVLDSLCETPDGARRLLVFNAVPSLRAHPHPVRDVVTFDVAACEPGVHRLEILDLDGRIASSASVVVSPQGRAQHTMTLPLLQGVYVATLRSSGCVCRELLVIHR